MSTGGKHLPTFVDQLLLVIDRYRIGPAGSSGRPCRQTLGRA